MAHHSSQVLPVLAATAASLTGGLAMAGSSTRIGGGFDPTAGLAGSQWPPPAGSRPFALRHSRGRRPMRNRLGEGWSEESHQPPGSVNGGLPPSETLANPTALGDDRAHPFRPRFNDGWIPAFAGMTEGLRKDFRRRESIPRVSPDLPRDQIGEVNALSVGSWDFPPDQIPRTTQHPLEPCTHESPGESRRRIPPASLVRRLGCRRSPRGPGAWRAPFPGASGC